MPLLMIDLVAKAQGKKISMSMVPDRYGKYRYKNKLKTMLELAVIGNIDVSTLHSRLQRGTYASIEEAVDTPTRAWKKE